VDTVACRETLRGKRGNQRSRLVWIRLPATAGSGAKRLSTSVRFVRRLVFERRIAYVKLGRHVRIATRHLDAFIRAGRVEVGQYPTLQRGPER
jgi:excisionase family DNA binding protein